MTLKEALELINTNPFGGHIKFGDEGTWAIPRNEISITMDQLFSDKWQIRLNYSTPKPEIQDTHDPGSLYTPEAMEQLNEALSLDIKRELSKQEKKKLTKIVDRPVSSPLTADPQPLTMNKGR